MLDQQCRICSSRSVALGVRRSQVYAYHTSIVDPLHRNVMAEVEPIDKFIKCKPRRFRYSVL